MHDRLRSPRFWLFGVTLTLVLNASTAAAASALRAPLTALRANSSSSVPIWVSARAAFRADGELRAELFSPVSFSMLNENRRQNSGSDCRVALGAPPLEDHTAKDSFDALVGNALTIIQGTALSSDTGFLNGVPGTLISLHVDDTYKSLGIIAKDGDVHVFIAEATIPTGAGVICSRTFSNIPTPVAGDKVLIFSSINPLDADHRILIVDERKQIVVDRESRVYRPTSALAGGAWPPACCADLKEIGSRILENKHLHDIPTRIQE